jgi:hapalindole-type alkaloid chlorinase
MSFLSRLLKKKSHFSTASEKNYIQEYSKEPYNFKTISPAELSKQDEAIWDIYANKSDGFLIKNFLSSAEVDTILSHFDKVLDDNPAHTQVGFTYPPIFAEFSNRLKNETEAKKTDEKIKYFKRTGEFNKLFKAEFGVDVKSKLELFFKSISLRRDIKVAETTDGKGNYPFSTFRLLVPDKGLMSVHCGNYFGKTFEVFYQDLTSKVAVENQMSFFIMLQEPEEGGELTLFNFRWKAGQTKKDNTEDNEIIQPDGSKIYVENNPNIIKDKIRPKKGDMILFQGGNIWHRVETVRGKTPRITFGGFIGISKDDSTFYYWS